MTAAASRISLTRVAAAAPLGFLIGLSLGALGGGGSILAVPALVYGAGEGARAATTSSLVVVGASALVGMGGHLKAGRVRLLSGLGFGLVGIGGSFVGSALNRAVAPDVLLLAFSGLILLAAYRMWSHHAETPCHAKGQPASDAGGRSSVAPATEPPVHLEQTTGADPAPVSASGGSDPAGKSPVSRDARRRPAATAMRVVAAGSVVGLLTGFFGVGGGFVIVPALVLALGYEMPVAVGTSLLVIAVSSGEGLVFRLGSEGVDWRVALPFTAAGIIGVLLGDRIAGHVPAATLSRWFVWLLIAVAAYTAAQSLVALM